MSEFKLKDRNTRCNRCEEHLPLWLLLKRKRLNFEHITGICALALLKKVLLLTCTYEQTTGIVLYLWLWNEAALVHG